jgi:hypothetical protein
MRSGSVEADVDDADAPPEPGDPPEPPAGDDEGDDDEPGVFIFKKKITRGWEQQV